MKNVLYKFVVIFKNENTVDSVRLRWLHKVLRNILWKVRVQCQSESARSKSN